MKPQHTFVAERAAAQHCSELLRAGPGAAELLPMLERMGGRLARSLAVSLASLMGGAMPVVRASAPREASAEALSLEIEPLAANSLLVAGAQDAPLLASLDAGAVLRLVDRAFGGKGEAPSPLPDSFPMSAELMIGRLETMVAHRIGQALGAEGDGAIRSLRRDGSLAQLAPFAANCPLAVLTLTVEEIAGANAVWDIVLAFPMPTLASLFGHGERPPAARSHRPGPADPASEPFADVPLQLTAVLVDMQIAVSAISQIRPGTILPVAVARSVPLRIGDKTIAHGTIGALDDRVAVQLTKTF